MTTEDACKLFVAGLPESMTETALRQLFEAAGCTVVELSLPRDRATGRPRGFGFVTLDTEEQAERARSRLDGSLQSGRSISVRPFQGGQARREPRGDAPTTPPEERTLYVGNLSYEATVDEVEQVLTAAGISPVLRVHLPVGPDGRPRGFGFVTLSSAEAVQQAVGLLQNAELRGRRVMVKVAHPRGSGASGPQRGGYESPRGGYESPRGSAGAPPRSFAEPERGADGGPPRAFRAPQPSTDFEEEEEGGGGGGESPGVARPRAVADKRGKASKVAGKGAGKSTGKADERRNRGGAASWQRWEDWDED